MLYRAGGAAGAANLCQCGTQRFEIRTSQKIDIPQQLTRRYSRCSVAPALCGAGTLAGAAVLCQCGGQSFQRLARSINKVDLIDSKTRLCVAFSRQLTRR